MSRLRWKICKHLSIPVDDLFFRNTNDHQLLWYNENIIIDEKEEYERFLDIAEYLASFINADAAKKAREHRKADKIESTEDVEEQLRNKDELFNDPLIKAIGETLKGNVTNNKRTSDISKFDIRSPIHKIIREG